MAPTSSNANAGRLSMKLLVDTKAQRVLYAEAGKDVVDSLFSLLLTLPLGTIAKILNKDSMTGSIGNLYGSVEELDMTYVRSADTKNGSGKLLRLPEAAPPLRMQLFRCEYADDSECHNNVTTVCGTTCLDRFCGGKMNKTMKLVDSSHGSAAAASPAVIAGSGFVQGVVTYTVMDDLKVVPMSTICSLTLLNTCGIRDIGMLREKTVHLGYAEGLKFLKASLQSKTVLTDVFL